MSDMTKTVLVLSSNPHHDLNLDKELREIRITLARKGVLDFRLEVSTATRLDDFQSEVLRHRPAFIHFCGHASDEKGLVLENATGEPEFVRPETLKEYFSVFAENFPIECVILNACVSEPQAKVIEEYVGYVIGMQTKIFDEDAIQFSRSFYSALIDGLDIQGAFRMARAQLTNAKPETKPSLIIGKVDSGPIAYNGEPLSVRIKKYGLVDLALYREELTWKYLSKTLDDLIDKMPPRSEFFIVARSLELWMKTSSLGSKTYLEKLAEKVVSDQLRCIFVLPDNDVKLKSLVLSDPSQRFREDLWNRIETRLRNIIEEAANQRRDDFEHGFVEIYTIPAYVPSTFSRITTTDGVEYCSLEVGIGIPPDEARVLLYFENEKEQLSIFERLTTIYRNIVAERKPAYKFPTSKNRQPEDKELLSKIYKKILSDFSEKDFRYDTLMQNKDWFNGDVPYEGEAACITTLPLHKYLGGNKMLRVISELRDQCRAIINKYPDQINNFTWLPDDSVHIPIFDYKTSFNGRFSEFPNDEADKLTKCISSQEPFRIEFRHFVIDPQGRIMLLGYMALDNKSNEESLSQLRDSLLQLSKIEFKHFDARRPQNVCCIIGSIINDINLTLLADLRVFIKKNFELPAKSVVQIEIDQLKLVRFKGNFAKYQIDDMKVISQNNSLEQPLKPVIFKTILLERYEESYGIITTGKWLSHGSVVDKVRRCAFDEITPITIHFSPSLSCKYNCPTCSYGCSKDEITADTEATMSREDMMSSIRKIAKLGVKGLIFTGGGEPLMNKNSVEGMKFAKQRRLSVGLFTNGYLLDNEKSNELLSDKNEAPDFIRFSINAGKPEAYRLIHGSPEDGFSTVFKNLESLCKLKLKIEAKTNIDVGVLITPAILDNLVDLAIEIKRLALKYPGALNSILFRPAISYVRGNRKNKYAEELKNSQIFGNQYKRFFKSKKQFEEGIFKKAIQIINYKIRPLLSMENNLSNVNVFLPEARFKQASKPNNGLDQCLTCNLVLFIAPDTGVYQCVERALEPDMQLGKLRDFSELNELLSSKKKSITSISTADCPPVCLLYETNIVWQDIYMNYCCTELKQELDHRIDIAREYFDRYAMPKIGDLVNFI